MKSRLQMPAEIEFGPSLHERAERLPEAATLMETVGIPGYCAFVALTLNAFDMRKEWSILLLPRTSP
ncbi:hypothetical protein H6CHR_00120 [Variovorax sp. PBL-H6]|nr:hypothetical protein H6CHR_00120 [Variovorax sp. PBL-H6]